MLNLCSITLNAAGVSNAPLRSKKPHSGDRLKPTSVQLTMALQPAVQRFLFDPSKNRETTLRLGILRVREGEATAPGHLGNKFPQDVLHKAQRRLAQLQHHTTALTKLQRLPG